MSSGLYERLEGEVVKEESKAVSTEALRDLRNSLLQQRLRYRCSENLSKIQIRHLYRILFYSLNMN